MDLQFCTWLECKKKKKNAESKVFNFAHNNAKAWPIEIYTYPLIFPLTPIKGIFDRISGSFNRGHCNGYDM